MVYILGCFLLLQPDGNSAGSPERPLQRKFFYPFIYVCSVCVCVPCSALVKIRAYLEEVCSLHHCVGPWNQTQDLGLGSQSLHSLSHHADPGDPLLRSVGCLGPNLSPRPQAACFWTLSQLRGQKLQTHPNPASVKSRFYGRMARAHGQLHPPHGHCECHGFLVLRMSPTSRGQKTHILVRDPLQCPQHPPVVFLPRG